MSRVRWLVDAFNVIGARPDGWWRDRPAAMRRLVERLEAFAEAEAEAEAVCVVLDADLTGLTGRHGGVEVVSAPRRGRDTADDEIARRVQADSDPAGLTVVTSDATLAARVRLAGAQVEGAGAFRRRLDF